MVTIFHHNAQKFLTELNTSDIPGVYERFVKVVGARRWTHRVAQMKAEIKHNKFLEAYLQAENEIAFGLERCGELIKHYGNLPINADAHRALYPAISFAAQSMSMMDLATSVEAERLRKRVAGTFQEPNAMRGMRLELAVATHFTRRGHRLQWPEMVGGGTFDLLVTDLGNEGVEVECKPVSDDKGRNIHRRDALAFHYLLDAELAPIRKSLRIGLSVVLTVPQNLPIRHADRQALAKRVRQQVTIGHSAQLESGVDVIISEFDLAKLDTIVKHGRVEDMRGVIDAVTGTRNREFMPMGTGAGGALAFVVQSMVEDDVLDATFKTLRDAAKRQLSGTRPALLIAGFDGLDGEQLLSIAQQDRDANQRPTGLTIKISSFLTGSHRDHIVGVGFLSRSVLRPVTRSMIGSGGTAYYFPNRESPRRHDEFSGLFI